MRGRALAALVAGLALAGCGTGANATGAGQSKVYSAAERKSAPAITGPLLEGGSYDLAQHSGEVIVVNFWASWCAPCRAEAEQLAAVAAATAPSRVSFIGIDVRDEQDKARAFLDGHPLGYPSVFDPAGKVALGFSDVPPNTTPATLVIDRKGRIAAVFRRAVVQSELEPVVRQIAGEPS